MIKHLINREVINKTCNRIFEEISSFFIGSSNYIAGDNVLSSDRGNKSGYTEEWDLHQGVSDIVIKDLRSSFSCLVPSAFNEKFQEIKKWILFYFYIDEEEDESMSPVIHEQGPLLHYELRPKVIIITGQFKERISSGAISIIEWWKAVVRKLEIWLSLDPTPKTYYLIGNFSPPAFHSENDLKHDTLHTINQGKLKSTILFHKRN
jgi:hypothetical protein